MLQTRLSPVVEPLSPEDEGDQRTARTMDPSSSIKCQKVEQPIRATAAMDQRGSNQGKSFH
jgi:hypothetical protein